MNTVVKYYSNEDRFTIEQELKRVFILQDKHISPEKLGYYRDELMAKGYTVETIMRGLSKIATEDLGNLKFHTIAEAIKNEIPPENLVKQSTCIYCNGSGFVVLEEQVETGKYPYTAAFSCNCPAGQKSDYHTKSAHWNGQKKTFWNGKTYIYPWNI